MDLLEYEGREVFSQFDVPTAPGTVVRTKEDIANFIANEAKDGVEYVVKAQVHIGGRGKAGGVKFATKENMQEVAEGILGMDIKGFTTEEVFIVEKVPIDEEYYLSLMLNRSDRNITMLFSTAGGMEIEKVADETPEKIIKVPLIHFDETEQAAVKDAIKGAPEPDQLFDIISKLFKAVTKMDATLVEINPLANSGGKLIAVDAKVSLDDNALYRHEEYAKEAAAVQSDIEKKATEYDLQYVELDGDVAIIGNGAGLVMATLDVVNHFGGSPANFLDIGGGASVEKMEQSLEVVLMKPGVKGIFINIFGGITRCDEIAQGLVNYRDKTGIKVPFMVRMTGTNDKEGKAILEKAGIESLDSMDECAQAIVKEVKA